MSIPNSTAYAAKDFICSQFPSFRPRIGLILGSGLGQLASELEEAKTIAYTELPGFPKLTVEGHSGQMVLGYYHGLGVVCLQGRAHTYEGLHNYEAVKTYVRTLKLLGCSQLLATNASGSLRENMGPGELMLITDHINLQPSNPLIGINDDSFGPRFYPLDNAYNPAMREGLLSAAQTQDINLHQGVYISVLGPHYETAAEIRAFKLWGADAVGMSTVPEVLVANHCGLPVAAIATITNYATGLNKQSHSHESVVATAQEASQKLSRLIKQYLSCLA